MNFLPAQVLGESGGRVQLTVAGLGACEIAAEFGVEPSPQVQRIAMTSKRNLKRINNPDDVMSIPYAIVGTRQRFNIFAGNY